jgi:hypothetical protein
MDVSYLLHGLIALGFWIAVGGRFVVTVRHGISRSGSAQRQAWYSWFTFFCIAIAATVYHPAIQSFFATHFGAWFSTVPRVSMALAAYVVGVHICYESAPQLRPRWNWPLYGGVVTLGLYVLIVRATAAGILPGLPRVSVLADLLFNAFILLIVTQIALPSIRWAHQHEQQRPMRLRFSVMWGMHVIVGLWMLGGITESLVLLAGGHADYGLFFLFLMIVGMVAFTTSHLMPAAYFVYGVRAMDYCADLLTFGLVRFVEICAARWTGRNLRSIPTTEVLIAPALAMYKSVIAIFDARKLLKVQSTLPPRILGTQLDTVARPELEYAEIVRRLRRIGLEEFRFLLGNWRYLVKLLGYSRS